MSMKIVRLTVLRSLIGGAFLVAAAAPSYAAFHSRGFNHAPLANHIRSDRNEIQQDRQELRDNRMELNQDRQKLDQDVHSGASHSEIAGDRAEIRQERYEIAKDRQDLGSELRALQQDLERAHDGLFER
jgi:septal ring factor EnvC (AmiA/AmiB activator)